ncbi:unnamed protein product [Cladocopium goreaui]|uniref:Methyltransferase FkbM domain-containing protein n=1 Tax=Cladocopium goreaui TaxID=2562237 RepID=A0A9P1G7M0_9DINO|nr:unnamed protein product [Cladocopium goreaui]
MEQKQDLSCEGYIHDGIDWRNLRRRFEIYADKYLDRPQLLAEEFEMAKNYAFSYSPENSCILGDLSLRFFLCLWLRSWQSVEGSKGMLAEIMEETWKWFWDLPQTWQDSAGHGPKHKKKRVARSLFVRWPSGPLRDGSSK